MSALLNAETANLHHDALSLITNAAHNCIDATFGAEDLPHRYVVGGVVRSLVISATASRNSVAASVRHWAAGIGVRAALAEGNRAVGVWTDYAAGLVYVDVVSSIADLDFALDVADYRGELAIWDTVSRRPVWVHPTADSL